MEGDIRNIQSLSHNWMIEGREKVCGGWRRREGGRRRKGRKEAEGKGRREGVYIAQGTMHSQEQPQEPN